MNSSTSRGLSLTAFRGLRYAVPDERLGQLLCPPYDVIDAAERRRLLHIDADNAVAVVLPVADADEDPYLDAADRLEHWIADRLLATDAVDALYVYEMADIDGSITRGLIGAVELRAAEDGVILPHENTMAGPVADRLALMTATEANLEPIYLVYDGGGAASALVSEVDSGSHGGTDRHGPPIATATTPDGITHRLWAVSDPVLLDAVATDLAGRRALIADGHHRYATYLQLQKNKRAESGPGPWDRGLALLVDSSTYGPQVHAIHRVLPQFSLAEATETLAAIGRVTEVDSPEDGLQAAVKTDGFAAVLTDGSRTVLLTELGSEATADLLTPEEPAALGDLDVTILHRGLVGRIWKISDDESHVGYAHSVPDAIESAISTSGTAVLMRPTPVAAVAAVAAAGARMPRKSTLFTPKPASGMVIRRFADQQLG